MEVPINVRRFMGGILLLPGGKGTGDSVRKEKAVRLGRTALVVKHSLEIEPEAELHSARRMRVGQVQEVARTEVFIDGIELGVIEEIESFPTEIEARLFVC